jgi:hypothetical protein
MAAASTWESRDLAVLEVIRAAEIKASDTGYAVLRDPQSLAAELDLPRHEILASLRDLAEAQPPYVIGTDASDISEWYLTDIRLTERGRRAVGQWPSEEAYDALLQLLSQEIDAEPEAEKRRGLEKMRDGVLQAGREVGVALLTAWAKAQAGL